MNEYKLIKKNEDPKLALIEKSGITATFTIAEIEGEQATLEKYLKEFNGQLTLEEAKMSNIEDNHPFVLEMSEQDCFTVHMYQEAKSMAHVYNQKIPEFEEQLEKSRAEMALVMEALDLRPAEEIVDEAVAKIVDNG